MNLAYDISRCLNDNCKLATNCLRFLAPGRPSHEGPQVFTLYPLPKNGTCEYQIPVEEPTND